MNVKKINEIVGGSIIRLKKERIKEIVIDSRKVTKGDLFVALVGIEQDGHNYIADAIKNGARAVLVSKEVSVKGNCTVIRVADTLDALQKLAKNYREQYPIPCIAITGSVGKSTTKELIAQILETQYCVLKNEGNQNNHIGVPLTLLKLKPEHQILITELGMNHAGEIHQLSKMVKPDYAVITNIGTAHIGNLGSKKNILKAKMEIVDGMNGGMLFLNGDDPYLKRVRGKKIKRIGLTKQKSFHIRKIKTNLSETSFELIIHQRPYEFIYPIPGREVINDVLLAIAIALEFAVPIEKIQSALKQYQPLKNRLNLLPLKNQNLVIDDCYNASYESVKSLLGIVQGESQNKVIILGDLLELGKKSKKIHQKIGKLMQKMEQSEILLLGEQTSSMMRKKNTHFHHFSTHQDLIQYLKEQEYHNTIFILKASRKMKLEEIKEVLKKDYA